MEYINNLTSLSKLNRKDLTFARENVKDDLPQYWEQDYIEEQINKVNNITHKVFLQFLRMSGLRVSEAIGIHKRDIDLDNFEINIKWLKSRKYHERRIPLHPQLKYMLEVFIATLKLDQLLFPFTRQRAYQIVDKYMKGNPHMFRHSFAVHWLRSDGTLETLCQMLGHSNIRQTQIYTKLVPKDQGKELIKLKF